MAVLADLNVLVSSGNSVTGDDFGSAADHHGAQKERSSAIVSCVCSESGRRSSHLGRNGVDAQAQIPITQPARLW